LKNSSYELKEKQLRMALSFNTQVKFALVTVVNKTRKLLGATPYTAQSNRALNTKFCLSPKRSSNIRYLDRYPYVYFNLKKIEFRGEHKISESQLRSICDRYLMLDIGQKELEQLEDKLTGLYQLSGYPFTQIYLSECDCELGVTSFDIVEGYIDQVLVNVRDEKLLEAIAPVAKQLLTQSPINWQIFHQYLTQLNALTQVCELELNFKTSQQNQGAVCAVISHQEKTSNGRNCA